jgi:phosphoserine phosphatase RsbU/P
MRRLFDRDASVAYRVLTRDQDTSREPKGTLHRLLFRIKVLFLGLAAKLTPARRVLFGIAVLFAIMGVVQGDLSFKGNEFRVGIGGVPLVFAVLILVFLLALELVDRVQVRDELEVARQLQADLLPAGVPTLAGFSFAHTYRTANEVGGDYYDFIELPGGRLAIVVGDASGHGMAAGLLMAIAAAVLRLGLELDPAPAKVLALVNRVLCRTGDRRAFMSMFLALLTPATGELEYVCAGHPFPVLRHADGHLEELGKGGFPLGIRGELELAPASAVMGPGDSLLLYSDGLPEAVNRRGEAFGFDRVSTIAGRGGEPAAVIAGLSRALDAHLAGEPLLDDLSLVVIARTVGAASGSQAASGAVRAPGATPPGGAST